MLINVCTDFIVIVTELNFSRDFINIFYKTK